MTAAQTLLAARNAGILITVVGDTLDLCSEAEPPGPILQELVRHKHAIIELLSYPRAKWPPNDWQAFFDERAGILEHDAGLTRTEAEVKAFECCVAEYINQNHTASNADVCAHCGSDELPTRLLLPLGSEESGHVWLHADCQQQWHRARQHEAAVALRKMSIGGPLDRQGDT